MNSAMTSQRNPEPGFAPEHGQWNEFARPCTAAMSGRRKWRETPDGVRHLLRRSPEPSLIIVRGRFVDCNRAAMRLLGLESKGQLMGMRPSDCSPPQQADGHPSVEKECKILASAATMGACSFYWRHRRKDTAIVPVEVTLTRLHVNGEDAFYTTWRDLTAQESLRAALGETEGLFREMFEQNYPLMLFDPATWRIVDANSAALRLYGYSKQTLIRRGIRVFMEPFEYERFTDAVRSSGQEGDIRLEKGVHVAHDGRRLLVTTRCRAVRFRSKRLLCCQFRDVSEELRLKQEADLIQGKLIHANKMTSLGVLVSSVAHEINNPNNFIMLNSSLLQEAWVDVVRILEDYGREREDLTLAGLPFPEMKEAIGRLISGVMDGSRRINSIVDNLKEFSQQSGKPSKGRVSINSVIRTGTSMLMPHINKHTNRFSLRLEDDVPDIIGDGRQLEQVVINLVLNALQALPDKERGVSVASYHDKENRSVIIRVEDEGTGMTAEVLDRVREPFFSTKLDSGGTGLGVYISYSILRDHDGSLAFESSEGHGTKAVVSLPAAPEVR